MNKPYYTKINGRSCYFVRYGSTSREASREELLRMFQSSSVLHYEVTPLTDAGADDLDYRQLEDYFDKYRGVNLRNFSREEADNILVNSDILAKVGEDIFPNILGMLLFGRSPKRFLTSSLIIGLYSVVTIFLNSLHNLL